MLTPAFFNVYLGAMLLVGFMGISMIRPVVSSMPAQFVLEDELEAMKRSRRLWR